MVIRQRTFRMAFPACAVAVFINPCILFAEWMVTLTVRLPGVLTRRAFAAKRILPVCDRLQVPWIATQRRLAQMVRLQTDRNRFTEIFIGKTMRKPASAVSHKSAPPGGSITLASGPDPARPKVGTPCRYRTILIYVAEKPVNQRLLYQSRSISLPALGLTENAPSALKSVNMIAVTGERRPAV